MSGNAARPDKNVSSETILSDCHASPDILGWPVAEHIKISLCRPAKRNGLLIISVETS
jgi:hypothetical protein